MPMHLCCFQLVVASAMNPALRTAMFVMISLFTIAYDRSEPYKRASCPKLNFYINTNGYTVCHHFFKGKAWKKKMYFRLEGVKNVRPLYWHHMQHLRLMTKLVLFCLCFTCCVGQEQGTGAWKGKADCL